MQDNAFYLSGNKLWSVKIRYYTAILVIIEVQFQVSQRFSSSKLVLKIVESCFVSLNDYENGNKTKPECGRIHT
jgi:hypothetical protein